MVFRRKERKPVMPSYLGAEQMYDNPVHRAYDTGKVSESSFQISDVPFSCIQKEPGGSGFRLPVLIPGVADQPESVGYVDVGRMNIRVSPGNNPRCYIQMDEERYDVRVDDGRNTRHISLDGGYLQACADRYQEKLELRTRMRVDMDHIVVRNDAPDAGKYVEMNLSDGRDMKGYIPVSGKGSRLYANEETHQAEVVMIEPVNLMYYDRFGDEIHITEKKFDPKVLFPFVNKEQASVMRTSMNDLEYRQYRMDEKKQKEAAMMERENPPRDEKTKDLSRNAKTAVPERRRYTWPAEPYSNRDHMEAGFGE